MSRAVITNKI